MSARNKGQPISKESIISRWKEAATEMGYDTDFSGHSIRRTVVKHIRDIGCSKEFTADFIGHAAGSTATELYDDGAALRDENEGLKLIKEKDKRCFDNFTKPKPV